MLDRRLHAYRADLAEKGLEGQVEAFRFIEGSPARIAVSKVALRPRPDATLGIDTELQMGEALTVFDRSNGWVWIKADLDSYVGYLPEEAISHAAESPTHWITAPRTFVYSAPDMRMPVLEALSMGSRLKIVSETETRGTKYLLLENGGAVVADHAAVVDQPVTSDYVAIAARFLETPYLWGGRTGFGIDCSGLTQLSMMMAGRNVLRDSDQQRDTIGREIGRDDLRRGDLVFWKGHVAIMEDQTTMIHANGKTMNVARETLADAIDRIAPIYGMPLLYRRP